MAAEGEMEKELIVHQRGYESFIRMFRNCAIACLIIAFVIILIIR